MNLITKSESKIIENPIINDEFKEEVIHIRQTKTSPKAETPRKPSAIEINIVSELVAEILPAAIKRFHVCDCDMCVAELTVEALNLIPPKYVSVSTEKDMENIRAVKEKYRREVTTVVVNLVLKSKSKPRHTA